jgi:hypothetical protein
VAVLDLRGQHCIPPEVRTSHDAEGSIGRHYIKRGEGVPRYVDP